MILKDKATQFFTSEEEYKKAKELGIDMSDSYFVVCSNTKEIITRKELNDEAKTYSSNLTEGVEYFPTYTLSELLYKLPEWISDKPYDTSIKYLKDAPFYGFCLYTEHDDNKNWTEDPTQEDIDNRIECIEEYPIRAAMQMLFECARNPKLWYVKDVSNK